MKNRTIYRKDYQPFPFELEHIDLMFDLHEEEALVEARMTMKRTGKGALHLCGDDLTLVSIHLNEQPLTSADYQFIGQDLVIETVPDHFALKIKTKIYPHLNTQLSGLYRSQQFFCTQCEAQGFRRMMYFPDRPDVLTVYKTRIVADKQRYPILLSNGNLINQGTLENGRHWVEWEDPFKKPSYLFALVAGDLGCVTDSFITQSGRDISLRFYVEKGQEERCLHAVDALKHAMRWDEEKYGREYDLDIYMIVAVSDFNMGAMENKGLNIFNAKYILASPDTATDADYVNIEGVVGHEYFHNWTGNRVTCRDWFQLSLKEGLTVFRDQTFSEDRFARDVKRIEDVKIIRNVQFSEDAGPMAHPVRPDSYQEINNFYTTTVYNKGAEVIRMQQTLLGEAGFRKGMDLYFSRNDGRAVTIDDFVAAMEDANGQDLKQFKRWYSQAGTPEVHVERHDEPGKLSLTLTQSCPLGDGQPFHIPIRLALFSAAGEQLAVPEAVLSLKQTKQTFEFDHVPPHAIVSLLRDFSAPIKLHFKQTDEERLALMRYETDGFAKWEAMQQLALACLMDGVNNQGQSKLPKSLAEAYHFVLNDNNMDRALRAELLIPPGFEELANCFKQIEVNCIEDARDTYRIEMVKSLQPALLQMIASLWEQETHHMQPDDFARRRLRHTCLSLLCKAQIPAGWAYCEEQFIKAKTMSDEAVGLALLAASPDESRRQHATAQFYKKWQNDTLVLDKWFAAQASANLPDVLQHIESLLNHPKFSLNNPNKVRALIGTFANANPRHFHQASGQGYAFLTEMILKLDSMNAQVAARLVTPLIRFRRFDLQRQALMRAQLERLAARKLSKDVSEVVMKSLDSET
jgi:aminopeptidase N